ncbi:MAG: putative colanic acid biosynthesis acetyltransferase [Phycisphaerae bacterium]|nr:putative colanic acid biosynthesis acetyltransferase [Phycisphaerae bacterium]
MPSHPDVSPGSVASIDPEVRYRSPYSTREKIGRFLWAVVEKTVFRLSFPTWYGWRASLLRLFGARVGPQSQIRRTVHFECPWNFICGDHCAIGEHAIIYALGTITLGNRVSISQYSHLCAGTHDFQQKTLPLLRPPIVLKDDAWLGAEAFIGPGVTLHEGALLGARGSAFKDLDAWSMNAGNPARRIKDRPRIDLM